MMQTWIKYVRAGSQETAITAPKGYRLHTVLASGDIGVYFVFLKGN